MDHGTASRELVRVINENTPVLGTRVFSLTSALGTYFNQAGIPVLRFFAKTTGLEFELVVV